MKFNWDPSKPWSAVTFTSDYIIALRISRRNPRYYYHHEKYGDPIQLIYEGSITMFKIEGLTYYYRGKIHSLKGFKGFKEINDYDWRLPFDILDFVGKKFYTARLIKGFDYTVDWRPAGVKFYLLKIFDSVDLEYEEVVKRKSEIS